MKREGKPPGRRVPHTTRPILSLACEGHTEHRHAGELARGYRVNLKGKVFPGRRNKLLIDDALALARRHKQEHQDSEVIPLALCDLEIASNANLRAAREAKEYAQHKGVHVFFNAPTIERWFLLGLGYKSIRTSSRVITQELNRLLRQQGMQPYRKPGNAYLHYQLALLVDNALERCRNGGHLEGLPCMCEYVELIRSF